MVGFCVKVIISALLIAGISELSRRYSTLAALLASLPLVSLISFVWIYIEQKSSETLVELSYDIFWLVLPSLAFFLLFPLFIKYGLNFWLAMGLSCTMMIGLYFTLIWGVKHWG